jgi:hypothetical protein
MVGIFQTANIAVTPSDTIDDPLGPFLIMVQTSGTYKISLVGDSPNTGTVLYLVAGVEYNKLVRRVWSTGISGTVNGFSSGNTGG